jgi:hypothetical protein
MGPAHPVGEALRCLVWGRAVERHHGGRDAGAAPELRAPLGAGGGNLDFVGSLADKLFVTMNVHVWGPDVCVSPSARSYAGVTIDQAKRVAKIECTRAGGAILAGSVAKNIFVVSFSTGFARVVHSFSTLCVRKGGSEARGIQ